MHPHYFRKDVFTQATEPKELPLAPGAGHIDLYNKVNLIPWDKLSPFSTPACTDEVMTKKNYAVFPLFFANLVYFL